MKHKLLTFALMGAFASTMLFSCKNAEEPIPFPEENNSGEMVEYSISVNIPEEMRTRTSDMNSGESGLLEWPDRNINTLWYGAIYDGEVKMTGTVNREDSNPFKVSVKLDYETDPSKLYFFFWAGNENDNITFTNSGGYDFYIDLNNHYVAMGTTVCFNKLELCDSFTGYFQFSAENDKTIRNRSFILKRPFAEFHILSDDFISTESDLINEYPNGISIKAGFGERNADKDCENLTSTYQIGYYWYFDDGKNVEKDIVTSMRNSFLFCNSLSAHDNINRVSFKERQMDYYHHFFSFAPQYKKPLKYRNSADQPFRDLTKLQIAVLNNDNLNFGDAKYITIQMPEDGIQANTKYIIYNKPRSEGGTGFLDTYMIYEVEVNDDKTWNENSKNEVDRI